VAELLLEAVTLGDIPGVEHDPGHLGVSEQAGDGGLDVPPTAVVVPPAPLGPYDEPLRCRSHPLEHRRHRCPIVGMDPVGQPGADHLVDTVAQDAAYRPARLLDPRLGVGDDDHVVAVIDQGPETGLAASHPLPLGLGPFGSSPRDALSADQSCRGQDAEQQDGHKAAVGLPPGEVGCGC
jgi:hypothetical protein